MFIYRSTFRHEPSKYQKNKQNEFKCHIRLVNWGFQDDLRIFTLEVGSFTAESHWAELILLSESFRPAAVCFHSVAERARGHDKEQ